MCSNKRTQASMEFLITHGWSLLLVFVVIITLVSFGVFNPDTYLKEKAEIEPGIVVKDVSVNENFVQILVKNAKGKNIKDFRVNITACNNSAGAMSEPIDLPEESTQKVTVFCSETAPAGARFKSRIETKYVTTSREHGLDESVDQSADQGLLITTIQDGRTIDYRDCDVILTDCKRAYWESGIRYCLDRDLNEVNGTCMNLDAHNVTFDGKGHTIDGNYTYNKAYSRYGIYSGSKQNTTIANVTVTDFFYGLVLSQNTGIIIDRVVTELNYYAGMYLYYNINTSIENSYIGPNQHPSPFGLWLRYNTNTTMIGNTMEGNYLNFHIEGTSTTHFDNTIDPSNYVEDGRLYYYYNVMNYEFNPTTAPDAGAFYCIHCDNVVVKGLELKGKTTAGVYFYKTNDSRIEDVDSESNQYGIYLRESIENTLISNRADSNYDSGIYLHSSYNNTLRSNLMESNSRANFNYQNTLDLNLNYNDIDISNIVDGNYELYFNHTISDFNYTSLTTPNAGAVYCINCTNVSVRDLDLSHVNSAGVYLCSAVDSGVKNVTSNRNIIGIHSYQSGPVYFMDLLLKNNKETGLYIQNSYWGNYINNVNATSNYDYGIRLNHASYVDMSDTNMTGNYDANFIMEGFYPTNSINTSNIVDNEYTVYYNYSISDFVYDKVSTPDAGTIYCINCENVTIKDLNLSHVNDAGIYFHQTDNSRIDNVNVSKNVKGVYLSYSDNNNISSLIASKNKYGVYLNYAASNELTSISSNENTQDGFYIVNSSENQFEYLAMDSNSGQGIYMISNCFRNTFNHLHAESNNNYGLYMYINCDNNEFNDFTLSGNKYGIYIPYYSTFGEYNNNVFNEVSACDSLGYDFYCHSSSVKGTTGYDNYFLNITTVCDGWPIQGDHYFSCTH